MIIERVVNYESNENCYIVYNKEKNGFLIDPGSSGDVIEEKIKSLGVNIKHILLTHCHYDHIEGLEYLRKKLGARVYASFECNKNIQNPSVNLSGLFSDIIKCDPADEIVNDKSIIEIDDLKIEVIKTPGHTNGCVCYLIENELFSGDTLFLRNVGRWDFPTGSEETLVKSIKEKLYTLDDDCLVHPGHGNDTKIYYEKYYNTFVRG